MIALLFLVCYAIGSFLSFLLVNYVCGYRGYDETDRGMNCIFTILAYPIHLPLFFLFPLFIRLGSYLESMGYRANKSAIAKREAKEALKALQPKPMWVDEPTSYRTSEKVKKYL